MAWIVLPFPNMLDTIFLTGTALLFVVALAYVWGCDKL